MRGSDEMFCRFRLTKETGEVWINICYHIYLFYCTTVLIDDNARLFTTINNTTLSSVYFGYKQINNGAETQLV